MNIYESMNKAFDAELNKVPTAKSSSKLNESMEEKPTVEFKAIEIPAPFNTYYRTLQPEEYEDMIGCSYEECAADDAADYGVDEIQYIIAQDNYKENLQDAGMEILSVYKDGDVIGVGQEVGGRLFPVDYIDIKDYIGECVEPAKKVITESADSDEVIDYIYDCAGSKPKKVSLGECFDWWRNQLTTLGASLDEFLDWMDYVSSNSKNTRLTRDFAELIDNHRPEIFRACKQYFADKGNPLDAAELAALKDSFKTEEKVEECVEPAKKESAADTQKTEDSSLEEGKKDRKIWDKVYGDLTMDGEQVQKGKTTQFNVGAGYDNTSQISTCPKTGALCVGANTLEELKPAADVAIKYKDQGVSYRMRKGSKYDKWAYRIEIEIPGVNMDECAKTPVEDMKEDVKCEGLSPIEKLKKAYPELNLD